MARGGDGMVYPLSGLGWLPPAGGSDFANELMSHVRVGHDAATVSGSRHRSRSRSRKLAPSICTR